MTGYPEPGDEVSWYGRKGTVVGVFYQPCAVIKWPDGTRTTVAMSKLDLPKEDS